MENIVKACYVLLFVCVFYNVDVAATGGRLVGDPVMMGAGQAGLIEGQWVELKERGKTTCTRSTNSRFRTIDGTCNNRRNEGASNTPLRRLVEPPAYEDNIGEPRSKSQTGRSLPSPRTISERIHPDVLRTETFTALLMQWGQFIDHDVTASPIPTEGGRIITCCGRSNRGLANPLPEECFPVRFPSPDRDFDGNCMEFVRSEPAEEEYGTSAKVREQLNALTAFVDASMVYGSEPEVARELRTENGRGYLLRVIRNANQGDLLPAGPPTTCIIRPNTDDYCFLAGDIRVNEQPALATMHTIFVRLHNLIARRLKAVSSRRSSERIFQTARKIVGAITQNILYSEWLPIILGQTTMDRMGLTTGNRSQYVPTLDPSVLNEFSTAAYRMGHSLVPNALPAGPVNLRLRDHFLRPRVVRLRFNDIAQGLVNGSGRTSTSRTFSRTDPARARTVDQFVSGELTEHLFEQRPRRGFDLVAFNIQRGRDHGLRPYNDVRRACGLRPLFSFRDRKTLNSTALNGLYERTDDVDLFVGGLLEPPFDGGLVGETFNCVIANQFFLLKFGDRFFFETNQLPEGFTDRQLSQIRRVTMALVMCLTTDIRLIQPDAFRVPSFRNRVVDCDGITRDFGSLRDF